MAAVQVTVEDGPWKVWLERRAEMALEDNPIGNCSDTEESSSMQDVVDMRQNQLREQHEKSAKSVVEPKPVSADVTEAQDIISRMEPGLSDERQVIGDLNQPTLNYTSAKRSEAVFDDAKIFASGRVFASSNRMAAKLRVPSCMVSRPLLGAEMVTK